MISRYVIQINTSKGCKVWSGAFETVVSICPCLHLKLKLNDSPPGEVAYAATSILMTNSCNGQRTGSSKMQLLGKKTNAGEKQVCVIGEQPYNQVPKPIFTV